MIYLDVAGRCGNQMFQYAFARKLSLLNTDEITIDFYLMDVYAEKKNNPTFRDELCNFLASDHYTKIVDGSNKVYQYGSKKQVFVFKVYTKIKLFFQKICKDKRIANQLLYRVMSHYGIYWYLAPKKLTKCKEQNKFVFGYFEDPVYFDDIREVLIKDFTPVLSVADENRQLLSRIQNSNSVCVSFRQWNTLGGNADTAIREVCDKEYYEKALLYYQERISDPLFVIFSNNIEWVKANFDLPENCIFESGNDPIYEKVRLMSSCKHYILSNSTFAWWVQYLGLDKNKIVVSPGKWYNTDKTKNPLITKNFTIVG